MASLKNPSQAQVRLAQLTTADMSLRYLLLGQIRALMAHGYEVTGLAAPGKWGAEVRALGITVEDIPIAREISPIKDLYCFLHLIRRLRSYKVVNTHTPKAGLLGPLAARLAGVPAVVHTVHGFMFHDRMPWLRQAIFALAEFFTARCSHYLFFQSQEDLETATRMHFLPADRLFYIGNGIDVSWFDPARARNPMEMRAEIGVSPDDLVVGVAGRLVYEKGFREFFTAARQLAPTNPRLKFVIVGPQEPEQNDALREDEMRELQATGRFLFLGLRNDMRDIYRVLDLFVLPSHREGIPRALMEACAMQCPAVATDIRGCREVIIAEQTGLLAPVRDPQGLASAMERILNSPDRGQALALAGRQRILQVFDEELVHKRILDALEIICRERKISRPIPSPPCS